MDQYTTPDQARIRYAFHFGLALLVALVLFAAFAARNPAPPSGWQPQPDPPMVDNSVHINVLSGNKFFSDNTICIGSFDEC